MNGAQGSTGKLSYARALSRASHDGNTAFLGGLFQHPARGRVNYVQSVTIIFSDFPKVERRPRRMYPEEPWEANR